MLTPGELAWLLAVIAKGDQEAFERLYLATRAKLYGVILRILRRPDLADEVMQDTYLKIWPCRGLRSADCNPDYLDGGDRPSSRARPDFAKGPRARSKTNPP